MGIRIDKEAKKRESENNRPKEVHLYALMMIMILLMEMAKYFFIIHQ